jgi:hypothetical protein
MVGPMHQAPSLVIWCYGPRHQGQTTDFEIATLVIAELVIINGYEYSAVLVLVYWCQHVRYLSAIVLRHSCGGLD